MFVIMNNSATPGEIEDSCAKITSLGLTAHIIPRDGTTCISITGNINADHQGKIEVLAGVSRVIPISQPYRLVSREVQSENTIVRVGNICFGSDEIVMIGGPCAVESEESTLRIASKVAESGAQMLRGGAYKPRTSPYSFQGLEERGLEILAKARDLTGLPIVTEVVTTETVSLVAQYADMLQVGTRNMQNFMLLKEVAIQGKPVLLKRGMGATLDETLMSAEYLLFHGCVDVVLCERGIRTFNSHARNTLDVSIIPAIKKISHLPIIVDPSHSSGHRSLVLPHALAGIGAGCDGLLVDVHDRPEEALCDGPQALLPSEFKNLLMICDGVSSAIGRRIGRPIHEGSRLSQATG